MKAVDDPFDTSDMETARRDLKRSLIGWRESTRTGGTEQLVTHIEGFIACKVSEMMSQRDAYEKHQSDATVTALESGQPITSLREELDDLLNIARRAANKLRASYQRGSVPRQAEFDWLIESVDRLSAARQRLAAGAALDGKQEGP